MRDVNERERSALAAVARHCGATVEAGEATLIHAGRRVGVVFARLGSIGAAKGAAKPRLRFDKVALRFVADLRTALREPDGMTAILTVTAPIRQSGKTTAALEEKIRVRLASRARTINVAETIFGNAIRVRLLRRDASHAARLIGFVHNRDTRAEVLLDATQSLLERIDAGAEGRTAGAAGSERWLVVVGDPAPAEIAIYRRACAQLTDTGFAKMLMVVADGCVETLTG
jgi:hypothetical protein